MNRSFLLLGTGGYPNPDGTPIRLKEAAISVEKSDLTLGFYRGPSRWTGRWPAGAPSSRHNEGKIVFRFSQIDRKVVTNWVIGGFAMSVIKGEITYQGRIIFVYGFGERIK